MKAFRMGEMGAFFFFLKQAFVGFRFLQDVMLEAYVLPCLRD